MSDVQLIRYTTCGHFKNTDNAGDSEQAGAPKPRKFFPDGQPSLFMKMQSFKKEGHVNPAFERDDADTPDDTEEDFSSDPACRSSSSDRSDSEFDDLSMGTHDDFTGDPISNGNIPKGEKGNFKVEFGDLEEKTSPPPRSLSKRGKTPKYWDRFQTSSKDNTLVSSADLRFWDRVFVVTKIILGCLLFCFTLGTAMITKICLVIITANIFPAETSVNLEHFKLKTVDYVLQYKNKETNVQWIWALIMMAGAPHIFTCLKNVWIIFFQMSSSTSPSWTTIFSILLIETVHTIGVTLMMFVVLPHFDPISGILIIPCIAVIPGILKVFYPTVGPTQKLNETEKHSIIRTICIRTASVIAAVGQLAAIAVWIFHVYITLKEKETEIWLGICMVIAPIFTSIYWWENFIYEGEKESTGLKYLARQTRKHRTKLTLYSSVWNLILTLLVPLALYGFACDNVSADCVNTLYFKHDKATLNSGLGHVELTTSKNFGECNNYLPLIIASVGILCSGVCFKVGKVGCKIMTQVADYSLPLVLATPASIAIILGMYSEDFLSTFGDCTLPFPTWESEKDSKDYFSKFMDDDKSWFPVIAGVVAYISFMMVTNHVWTPGKERLQTTDRLFVQPLYCGVFTDQSLLLNRRRIEKPTRSNKKKNKLGDLPLLVNSLGEDEDDMKKFKTADTPMIYMCGTMWHETENEMTQLLKSIFRMDLDQRTRTHTQFVMNRRDPDYYQFEAHIFFDDAFEPHKENEYDFTVNEYVKLLMKSIDVSACSIHGPETKIGKPTKVATPYGGRLVWTLPGQNKLIAHLKDKTFIRHRKRWSQVMYMYYFLGYELLNKGYRAKHLQKKAENTFILALDGDVDFQPQAVLLLVDRMRKNAGVGAACGRIHPIGNGAMVWYQKFEYAISHWLQKAAEDKFGCVLCSPGCFSLFRGSALMDENVMHRYTTPPSEPRHYVQYDQGEDRWLCTLLLQQGHRVEYCAASDALTYAPEGFYEFFNQRRRWTPSTMANILDLLTDWKGVTSKNREITLAYVMYQALLMVSSILTPGTIFLMILGAINMAYPDIDLWYALLLNVVPIAIFVGLCFRAKSDTQLTYAAILSTLYSLVMMIVIVGLLRQAALYGWCSVTTIFLSFVGGVFVLSAFLHPQEFWCIIHGFLYFLAIPSMSMILMLYALGNLHVVSWGTRENKTAATQEAEKKSKLDQVSGFMSMFQGCCAWAPSATQREDERLRAILDRLDGVEQSVRAISTNGSSRYSNMNDSIVPRNASPIMMGDEEGQAHFAETPELFSATGRRDNPLFDDKQKPRDRMKDPYWIEEDEDMRLLEREEISTDESTFWWELIDEYLKPLDADSNKEKDIQEKLIELRNKVCLIFILINSLFVIVVFSLQKVVEDGGSLSFALPCADGEASEDIKKGQQIEPISVAFTVVFGILLLVQFFCMLMHRMATLLHICAATEIFKTKQKVDIKRSADPEDGGEKPAVQTAMSYQEVYELVKDLQRDQDAETASIASESSFGGKSDADDEDEAAEARRKVNRERWKKLAKNRRNKFNMTLGANFRRNFTRLQAAIGQEEEGNADAEETANDDEAKTKKLQQQFKRMRPQSLHVIKLMANDPAMKKNITNKKVRVKALQQEKSQAMFRNVATKVLAKNKLTNFGRVANVVKSAMEVEKIENEIQRVKAQPSPALSRKSEMLETTVAVERGNSLSVRDMNKILDSINKRPIPSTPKSDSSSEADMEEAVPKLTVPKVIGNDWPEEETYAESDDKLDVLF
ncbi:Chitin synthase 2 [Mactra antiquata]